LSSKIALLIDAENISYKVFPQLVEEIPHHGEVVLWAVYGDWDNPGLQKWHEIAKENDFIIRHQANKTNNASDMKLTMDAIEVVIRRSKIDIFCIVANDAHYVPLCDRLHEENKRVVVVGCKENAAKELIRSCTLFIPVECGSASQPKQAPIQSQVSIPVKEPSPKTNNQPKVRKLLKKAFAEAPQDNGWVKLSALGAAQPDFKANNYYGHANLSQLLQSVPDFVKMRTNSNVQFARLKKR
jgi:hypothetical protein